MGNFFDDTLQIPLHIFISYEEHIGQVLVLPIVQNVVHEWGVQSQIIQKPLCEFFQGAISAFGDLHKMMQRNARVPGISGDIYNLKELRPLTTRLLI